MNRKKNPFEINRTIFWLISTGIVVGIYGFIINRDEPDALGYQASSLVITVIGLIWYHIDKAKKKLMKMNAKPAEEKPKFKKYK